MNSMGYKETTEEKSFRSHYYFIQNFVKYLFNWKQGKQKQKNVTDQFIFSHVQL